MQYLRIENGSFGFIDDRLHEPNKNDILITGEDYEKFFKIQANGHHFTIKSDVSDAKTLFDYLEPCEEKQREVIPVTKEELLSELAELKARMNELSEQIKNL